MRTKQKNQQENYHGIENDVSWLLLIWVLTSSLMEVPSGSMSSSRSESSSFSSTILMLVWKLSSNQPPTFKSEMVIFSDFLTVQTNWHRTVSRCQYNMILHDEAHLAKCSSDLKQNGTKEMKPFFGTVIHTLSHGVHSFVASVSLKKLNRSFWLAGREFQPARR